MLTTTRVFQTNNLTEPQDFRVPLHFVDFKQCDIDKEAPLLNSVHLEFTQKTKLCNNIRLL